MPMSREELELMRALKRVIGEAPAFVVAFMSGETTKDVEIAFAEHLGSVADAIREHAHAKSRLVLDHDGQGPGHLLALEAGTERPS